MAPRLHLPCEPSSSCSRSISRSCGGSGHSPPLPAAPVVSHSGRGYSHVSKCMHFTGGWRHAASAAAAADNTPSSSTTASVVPTPSRWAAPTAAYRPSASPHAPPATRPTRGSCPRTRPRTLSNQASAADASVAAPEGAASAADERGTASDPRVVVVYDLSDQVIEYEQAWAWQRALLERVSAAAAAAAKGAAPRGGRHSLLLLQHPPVYTLGAGSTTDNLRFPPGQPPIPLYRTERGGEVTYHGPGQLVMYPILDLQALKPDLHWYLRQLEQVVIEAMDSVSGLRGERLAGLTGVWVDGAKVAAIGVRAKRWVSYHGLALNVVTDLAPFTRIVPCGITDRAVTSVARLMEARAAEEDPFAPPTAMEEEEEGAGGGGGSRMIPLAEATQEDLRRLLASTGMSPLVMGEPGGTGAAGTPGLELDLDDPFAPPLTSLSPSAPQAPQEPAATAVAVSSGGGAAAAAGVGEELRVRSVWSTGERLLLREYGCALLESFSEVFGLELAAGDPAELAGL